MSVYEIDPLHDPCWPELLEQHPRASVFHSRGWLEALKGTYGFEPVAYTTSSPGRPLENGWPFCRVRSWLTGNRLVSLPFSDHCDPLVQDRGDLAEISKKLEQDHQTKHWRYVECRFGSTFDSPPKFADSEEFCLHRLDLTPGLDELYANLHRNSTQRKIKRAEREELRCEQGNSEQLADKFYRLLVLTRRRHRVPPQPRKWFSNLLCCFGDDIQIRLAYKEQIPIAGILTLRFKKTLVYKYGAADEKFFPLGGMQMLLWRTIEEAKREGLTDLDLGRTDLDAEGLTLFKDRLGGRRRSLHYFRYPGNHRRGTSHSAFRKTLLSLTPARLTEIGGRMLYRHFA